MICVWCGRQVPNEEIEAHMNDNCVAYGEEIEELDRFDDLLINVLGGFVVFVVVIIVWAWLFGEIAHSVEEDEPGWDCATDGNQICGPGFGATVYPDGSWSWPLDESQGLYVSGCIPGMPCDEGHYGPDILRCITDLECETVFGPELDVELAPAQTATPVVATPQVTG